MKILIAFFVFLFIFSSTTFSQPEVRTVTRKKDNNLIEIYHVSKTGTKHGEYFKILYKDTLEKGM